MQTAATRFESGARLLDDFDHGFLVADSERRPILLNDAARRFVDAAADDSGGVPPLRPWMRLSRLPILPSARDPLDDVILGAPGCGPELVVIEDSEGRQRVLQVSVRADEADGDGGRLAKATIVTSLHSVDDGQMSPLFTAVFEEAPVAMGLAEVDDTGAASIIRVNGAYSRLLGFSPEELLGRGGDLLHPDDAPAVNESREGLATGRLGRHVTEARILRGDGSYMWGRMSRATVHDRPGRVRYVLSIVEDITEQKKRERELGLRAFTDPLTGLLNRASLMEVLSARLDDPSDGRPAVALIDLDNFKAVNDRLGHAQGDEVLVDVARGLRAAVRPSDAVARLGGDEFVIVAEVASEAEAARLGDRIANHVRVELETINRTSLGASSTKCGGSVGIVLADTDDTPATVLERADRAMYAVKNARHEAADTAGRRGNGT